MANDTKNFKVSEFACKHCGENKIDQKVIDIAQALRDELGVPVRVNSGYRCEKHNAKVGGVKGSFHTKGLAADLSCELGAAKMFDTVQKLWRQNKLPELKYCIYYAHKNFIHVDCGKQRKNYFEVRT
ncbi:MAG: hypothetical protein IJS28_07535 [Synergistaceae bacterium]|nr:hypothetical protein [Synergistaceae bacterium]